MCKGQPVSRLFLRYDTASGGYIWLCAHAYHAYHLNYQTGKIAYRKRGIMQKMLVPTESQEHLSMAQKVTKNAAATQATVWHLSWYGIRHMPKLCRAKLLWPNPGYEGWQKEWHSTLANHSLGRVQNQHIFAFLAKSQNAQSATLGDFWSRTRSGRWWGSTRVEQITMTMILNCNCHQWCTCLFHQSDMHHVMIIISLNILTATIIY